MKSENMNTNAGVIASSGATALTAEDANIRTPHLRQIADYLHNRPLTHDDSQIYAELQDITGFNTDIIKEIIDNLVQSDMLRFVENHFEINEAQFKPPPPIEKRKRNVTTGYFAHIHTEADAITELKKLEAEYNYSYAATLRELMRHYRWHVPYKKRKHKQQTAQNTLPPKKRSRKTKQKVAA